MSMNYDICPVAAPRMTQRDKWAKRPAVMRYQAYRDKVRLARMTIPQPCRIIFWMPMPKSWSLEKRKNMLFSPCRSKPDLDNLLKGLLDAVFYKQGDADKCIWSVWCEKRWTDETGHISIGQL